MKWQPIETAPKDGSHILAYEGGGDMYRAAWDAESECWSAFCGQPVAYTPEPELWQSLPDLPCPENVSQNDSRNPIRFWAAPANPESDLLDYERDILRTMNGEQVEGVIWGAAMSECLGSLKAKGYAKQEPHNGGIRYVITDAGRAALASR